MKLGLAFAGGGIRGIAHAGILKAFEENNIKPQIFAGTSSGSHIAILSAMGFSALEILELFHKYAYSLVGNNSEAIILDSILFNKKIKLDGFRTGKPIEDLYNDIALQKGFKLIQDIKIPVATVATDVVNEKEFICSSIIPENTNYISDITIGKAVRASSSFSVVFDPCPYKETLLLDGGILNNLPVDVVKNLGADKIIAVKFNSDSIDNSSNIIQIGMKTIDMMSNKISEINANNSDFILTIDSDGTSLLDIENIDYCFESGYNTAISNMDKIKEVLNM